MPKFINLHMTHSGYMTSVAWEAADGGQRFHVWLAVDKGTAMPLTPYRVRRERRVGVDQEQATLFVNPPVGTDFRGPGYFRTRYRDAHAKANANIVAEALRQAEADGLLAKCIADAAAAEAARTADIITDKAAKLRNAMETLAVEYEGEGKPDLAALLRSIRAEGDDATLARMADVVVFGS